MITEFKDENRFLSNFSPCTVEYAGLSFRSVEHAFVAAKTEDRGEQAHVQTLTAGQAKRFGRNLNLRPSWDLMKIEVMRGLLEQKFELPEYKKLLIATGSQQIVEGNTWGDTFWGMVFNKDGELGEGNNNLGLILMEIRENLVENNA